MLRVNIFYRNEMGQNKGFRNTLKYENLVHDKAGILNWWDTNRILGTC